MAHKKAATEYNALRDPNFTHFFEQASRRKVLKQTLLLPRLSPPRQSKLSVARLRPYQLTYRKQSSVKHAEQRSLKPLTSAQLHFLLAKFRTNYRVQPRLTG